MTLQLPKWSDLDYLVSMENKLSLYEAYTANNGNIFESNEPTNLEAFDRLARSGDTLSVNSEGLVITLVLMNNELSVAQGPELVKLIEKRPNSYLLELLEQENRIVEFPIKTKSVSVPIITLLFKTVESYNKLNTLVTMVFGKVLPKYEDKNITENKMSSIMKGLVDETEAKKGIDGKRCWKGKRYAGTENGKDKCIPVKNESAYEADLDENEPRIVIGVYGAKSKEFRKKFRNQAAQDRFFDHPDREGNYEIHYVQKADVSEGVIIGHDANDPEVAVLGGAGSYKLSNLKKKAQMEANELAKDVSEGKFKNSAYNVKQLANTLNTIVAAEEEMEKNYFGENAWNQLGQRKPNTNLPAPNRGSRVNHGKRFEEGDIVLPLSGPLKGQPHKVIHSQRTSIRIVPLGRNTYPGDTIAPRTKHEWVVPADINEDYTGMFAAEKTAATNPYGGQKDRQFRGAISEEMDEARQMSPALRAAQKNLAGLASGEVQRQEKQRKAAEKAQRQASKDLDRMLNRKPAKKTKQDLQTLWAKIESVIANSFPDGDPYDQLWPYMQKHGFTQDDVERASKMNGYDDLWDYWNTLTQDIENDAYADWQISGGKNVRTRGTFVETPTDNPTGASGEGGWRRTDMREVKKSAFRQEVERQQYETLEKIANSSLPHWAKEYLTLLNDPKGKVFKAGYRSFPKGQEARAEVAQYIMEKYKVPAEWIKKVDLLKGMHVVVDRDEDRHYNWDIPSMHEDKQLDEKCWTGYKQVGMKNKGGKQVPNCVPKESAIMKGLKR